MNTVSPTVPPPRIVIFGIQCAFTQRVINDLSARGLPPVALMLPGHPEIDQPLRVSSPVTTIPLAGAARTGAPYPTYRLGRLNSPEVEALVVSLQPDYIVVACFPRLIPRRLRDVTRVMSLNIHPSLLPQHRGPDPIFWIMRDGGAGCGVTVHELSGRYDAGPIVAQRTVPYPSGARESEVEAQLAAIGAILVGEFIESGKITDDAGMRPESYESWPGDDDHVIDAGSPVLRTWNFVRGVAERGVPVRIDSASGPLYVTDAVAFGDSKSPPRRVGPNEVVCRFSDGWIIAVLDDSSRR